MTDRDSPFHPYHTAYTVRKLRENHLTFSCFDSAADLSAETDPTDNISELISKAHDVCCPYVAVRVNNENYELIDKRLKRILTEIENSDVTLLIKT